MHLTHDWYDEIRAGRKCCEMRAATVFWQSRLTDATHLDIRRGQYAMCACGAALCVSMARRRDTAVACSAGYRSRARLVKRIIRTEEVQTVHSAEYGGPPFGTPEHEELFGHNENMFVVHFEVGLCSRAAEEQPGSTFARVVNGRRSRAYPLGYLETPTEKRNRRDRFRYERKPRRNK